MRMGTWIFVLGIVAVLSVAVAAEPTQVDSVAVNGGDIIQKNLTITENADDWAGIYGTISGSIVLGEGGHTLFEWTMTTLPSYIYITYSTDVDWSSLQATDTLTFSSVLSNEIGWSSEDELVQNTFTYTNEDCGTGTKTIAAKVYGDYDGDDHFDYEWPVCAYTAGSRAVYAAKVATGRGSKAFNHTSADYEAIVAVPSGGTTVYFYSP